MAKNNQIEVNGIDIKYKKINKADYISLTDIARYKNPNEPRFTVYNWLRNKETLRFLCVWEELNNPDFNRVEFDTVTKDAGTNAFMITPSQWIEKLNGIGLTVSAGRYNSGVYAHRDIAFEFARWYNQTYEVSSMNCLTALIEILRLHELSLSAHELHFVHEGNSNHDAYASIHGGTPIHDSSAVNSRSAPRSQRFQFRLG